MLPDSTRLGLARVGLGAHAEPEVVPLLGTGSHLTLAVDSVPLTAKRVAGPSEVKGLAAGHFGREEGFGDAVMGRRVGCFVGGLGGFEGEP